MGMSKAMLGAAIMIGLGSLGGMDIGVEERRYRAFPTPQSPLKSSKMQQTRAMMRDKRKAKNKLARKSRQKGR